MEEERGREKEREREREREKEKERRGGEEVDVPAAMCKGVAPSLLVLLTMYLDPSFATNH